MAGRHVAKSTKLSDDEFTALLQATEQQAATVSTWIADAVRERLVREGYLSATVEPDPTAPPACEHPAKARAKFPWGSKCDDTKGGCGRVLTGQYAVER